MFLEKITGEILEKIGSSISLDDQLARYDVAVWDYLTTGSGKEMNELEVALLNVYTRTLIVCRYLTAERIKMTGNHLYTEEISEEMDIRCEEVTGFDRNDYDSAEKVSGLSPQKLMGIKARAEGLIEVANGRKSMKGEVFE